MAFILDERLAASSFMIEDWPLCQVRLKADKSFSWLVLIPRHMGISEIFDLSPADRHRLSDEIAVAGRVLKQHAGADKINTAAYGNIVPQLHIHVFARHKTDRAWPKPVWAVQGDEIAYTEAEMNAEITQLRQAFARLRAEGEPI